jgi:presenilin 1
MFASAMLLGFLGGQMFTVAINKYQLAIDKISFYITMYNFAIVGVAAVFYQKGMPSFINQSYLVATSVIVAWQLSYFNDWMAWTLLIMLALYDLFAVLSPCGPLKALVNLMSKDDAPSMPGLLYEARLPENATRPGRQRRRNDGGARNQSGTEEQNVPSRDNGDTNASADDDNGGAVLMLRGGGSGGGDDVMSNGGDVCSGNNAVIDAVDALETRQKLTSIPRRKRSSRQNEGASSQSVNNAPSENDASMPATEAPRGSSPPTVIVPLAIAKVYKLPLVPSSSLATIASLDASSPIAYLQQEHPFTAADLQTNVEVGLPRNGGRIETTHNGRGKPRYVIYNREGQLKRTLLVDETGLVMEVVPYNEDGKTDTSDNNIKLGLGDFIFYSVLVSKAADHGFAAFVACFLSVLAGLGGTLVLLAIFHHALPALPISIFLAVIMFILTISCMEPWIEGVWSGPYYV